MSMRVTRLASFRRSSPLLVAPFLNIAKYDGTWSLSQRGAKNLKPSSVSLFIKTPVFTSVKYCSERVGVELLKSSSLKEYNEGFGIDEQNLERSFSNPRLVQRLLYPVCAVEPPE